MVVKEGDNVKVEYEGSLDDGTIFDSSKTHGKPLEFKVGSGQLIKGFDSAVIGMKKGEEKKIKLKPADAYGEPNPELAKELPREHIPKDPEPKPGMALVIGLPDGNQIPALITKVTKDKVTIDLNHPLAGKNLTFKIKVIEITKDVVK